MPTRLELKLAEALGAAEAAEQQDFEGQDGARRYCDANKERLTRQARAALAALLKMAEESASGTATVKSVVPAEDAKRTIAGKQPCTGQITVGPEGLANGRYVTINTPKLDPISNLLRAFGYADRREVRHLQMRQIASARRMPTAALRA